MQNQQPLFTLRIPPKSLQAINTLRSHDETRYTLCGVCVEVSLSKPTLLIATDGRRLGVLRLDDDAEFNESPSATKATFIIPNDLIEGALAAIKTSYVNTHFTLAYFPGTAGSKAYVEIYKDNNYRHSAYCIDGNYPNWPCVIPETLPENKLRPGIALNLNFASSFEKIADILGTPGGIMQFTGTAHDPLVVRIGGNFVGVLMPMRDSDLPADGAMENTLPKWLQERIKPPTIPQSAIPAPQSPDA